MTNSRLPDREPVSRGVDFVVSEADINSVRNLKMICQATLLRNARTGHMDAMVHAKLMAIFNEVQDLLLILSTLVSNEGPKEPDGIEMILG